MPLGPLPLITTYPYLVRIVSLFGSVAVETRSVPELESPLTPAFSLNVGGKKSAFVSLYVRMLYSSLLSMSALTELETVLRFFFRAMGYEPIPIV